MGRIYEEIEVDGRKVRVKVDTGSDFPLALKRDIIRKLKLKKHPTAKALLDTEEGRKESPAYMARIKIKGCEFGSPQPIVEAFGEDNLLGHPILQALGAKIDEKKERIIFDMTRCPTGSRGGVTGKIVMSRR